MPPTQAARHRPPAFPVALTLALSAMLFAPLNATETDDRIVSAAQSSYVFKTFLIDDAIRTESKDGAVTLTGTVHEDSHKQLAQETVSGLPGVKSVSNMIEVKDSPPAQSDTWLYLKVKGALAYHSSVSAYHTKVDLKQGVVTLTGETASEAQKELTTAYAKDVDGVKDVKNEMTVVANKPTATAALVTMIDDASITAQVRMALLTHRSTSAFKTTVSTTVGVVTVGGAAKNAAEKELVTKLVTDINGVKSVVNNMVVELAAASN
ncbi:BON domain-containing protein [Prosthecobacter sp.]|uniref:BON domain-containing protein n=1 Tax=Prosthecobacter sp. TaxID=1965333 RepID=UPI002AB8FAF4|nr:BON domain-containing protein [Prosthecobacter sp.]MDZ4401785.1 BON domain-containing protein [Prosthecobacter sp.]